MEAHLVDIFRFMACVLTLIISLVMMIRLDDEDWLRRLTAVAAGALIYFNEQLGRGFYLLVGSVIEACITTMGLGFVLILCASIMVLPLVELIRRLFTPKGG